jgi:hypothetical protein
MFGKKVKDEPDLGGVGVKKKRAHAEVPDCAREFLLSVGFSNADIDNAHARQVEWADKGGTTVDGSMAGGLNLLGALIAVVKDNCGAC